jgi:putative transposon-encoded protein
MSTEIEEKIKSIENWNKESIYELKNMLNELTDMFRIARAEREITDSEYEWYQTRIDITDLPSADIPVDIDTGYPVWAMDKNGFCLTGEDMQGITHIDDLRIEQADRRATTPHTISVTGYEIVEKIAKARGSSGGVYVPPDWIGKRVAIIRLD